MPVPTTFSPVMRAKYCAMTSQGLEMETTMPEKPLAVSCGAISAMTLTVASSSRRRSCSKMVLHALSTTISASASAS